jgi:fatty-acyl-CoA synthase
MAKALIGLGIEPDQRVGTLAWNGYRHMELYYAVSGIGAILHTINPRLYADQLAYIADHAEDQVLLFDLSFLPQVEVLARTNQTIHTYVLMVDKALMPRQTGIANLLCYEDLIAAQDDQYIWPELDENQASALCYTSGTTGNPKGVLFSHRSTVLHAFTVALPDGMHCSACEVILPVVPMFHVNAWGLPYAACMVGAKLVFAGPGMDGKSLYELCEGEGVTMTAGVPTIWLGLLAQVQHHDLKFTSLKRILVGGSACPPSLIRSFQEDFGVQIRHVWGMTEMSPLGTVCAFKPKHAGLSVEQRYAVQTRQGRAVFGVDMRVVDEDGNERPWGDQTGALHVRGPWVTTGYFRDDGGDPLIDGWFPTGDVVNIDADGYMKITDRSKDLIKSGGEWIGSIDLENIALSHPGVAMVACIGVPHPRWDERPLIVAIRKPGCSVTREELLCFYEGKIAKWWTPDDVVFVDAIPLGGTGKVLKNKLREQFRDYKLPGL